MNAEFTEEQILLRESAREFLTGECPMSLVREVMEDPAVAPAALWKQMAELGWMGLVVAPEYGGAGLGCIDLAVLLEETGRCLLPAPFLSTVAIGATALRAGGSESQRQRWLPALAAGDLVVALAQLESPSDWSINGITLAPAARSAGRVLTGSRHFVRDAALADLFLVPVREPSGFSLLALESDSPGVSIERVGCIDQTRSVATVHFEETPVPDDAVLGAPGRGEPLLRTVHDIAKLGLCAEAAGGATAMLEMSTGYAKTREQFGRPIGSFQAIQHKCADMLVRSEGIRSATYYAAWALENEEPDAHTAACMAKSYAAEAYTQVCGAGIQIHGGLGFTWEQDLHLYYKRAKADELYLGSAAWNRELVARVLLDHSS